jgi:hypothetical protein
VAILQPFDARPQQSDCHTQEMDKTEHFVEITSGVVGKFRATSSLDNGDDQVQQEHLVRNIFELSAGNFGEFCPSTGFFLLGQTSK